MCHVQVYTTVTAVLIEAQMVTVMKNVKIHYGHKIVLFLNYARFMCIVMCQRVTCSSSTVLV
jgi:hypothetical protein